MPQETKVVVEPTMEPAAMEVSVQVATNPQLGEILVDGNGMTLYMYTKDEADKSNCAGGCLEAWPPLLADGTVIAGDGVDANLLGETALADGSMIRNNFV